MNSTVKSYDAIIVGGGHNALVTAFYLARAGVRTLVLERRNGVGGAAVTEDLYPGFKCPALAHAVGPLHPKVVDDLALHHHGVRFTEPEVRLFAPLPDHRTLLLPTDPVRAADSISAFSQRDSKQYLAFSECLDEIGSVLRDFLWRTPPSTEHPKVSDVWQLLRAGRRFRGLGKQNMFRLLRWSAMPVADIVADWFETEALQAIVAARGIYGMNLGPKSAGSGMAFLLQQALGGHVLPTATTTRGGLGSLSEGLAKAAQTVGVEIRTGTEVTHIDVQQGVVAGVVLSDGTVITARTVVSGADPKRTFLKLISATALEPAFVATIKGYRAAGTMAKINLALDALPEFTALASATSTERINALGGRIHIGPSVEYLERAFDASKYGGYSESPYLDVTIPTVNDSTLAPDGQHVMSICAQFAPYHLRDENWHIARDGLGDRVIRVLTAYAPGLEDRILHRQILTPVDLETVYGLTGGHIFHGEHSLDQLFIMRPALGWAQYRTPVAGLYLCGAGTHPGGGVTGACGLNASREILKDLRKN